MKIKYKDSYKDSLSFKLFLLFSFFFLVKILFKVFNLRNSLLLELINFIMSYTAAIFQYVNLVSAVSFSLFCRLSYLSYAFDFLLNIRRVNFCCCYGNEWYIQNPVKPL